MGLPGASHLEGAGAVMLLVDAVPVCGIPASQSVVAITPIRRGLGVEYFASDSPANPCMIGPNPAMVICTASIVSCILKSLAPCHRRPYRSAWKLRRPSIRSQKPLPPHRLCRDRKPHAQAARGNMWSPLHRARREPGGRPVSERRGTRRNRGVINLHILDPDCTCRPISLTFPASPAIPCR